MSIIVEALKKTQRPDPQKYYVPPEREKAAPPKKTHKINTSLISSAFLLLIFTAGALLYFLQKKPSVSHEATIKETAVAEARYDKPYPVKIKPVPADVSYDQLNLSGIMFLRGKSRAIINNRVFIEGEKISGFTIVKINIDSVEVESGGNSSILRLSR